MKVLVIDRNGDGMLDFCLLARALGHEIRWFLKRYDSRRAPIGRGLVEIVEDFRPWLRWADLVVMAQNDTWMLETDNWMAEGLPVIGGGSLSASWEIDRTEGMRLLRRCGIDVPSFREFHSYDAAIAYVKREDRPFAAKPSGRCDDKSLSYVAKTPEHLIWKLERWKKEELRLGEPFVLQEIVEGIEMAVGGWWGTHGWIRGWEENFEEKKLYAGGLGPNCGEMGTTVRHVAQSKLARLVLDPLAEEIERSGFLGSIDVNCIIDSKGNPWPLELTTRFGYPSWNITLALMEGDPVEFLAGLLDDSHQAKLKLDTIGIGIVMVLPPFPSSPRVPEEVVGVPIGGTKWQNGKPDQAIHPCEMMWDKDTGLMAAGSYLLIATGTAATTKTAQSNALRTLAKITTPASAWWREDIGRRLRSQLPELQRHGFASRMEYAASVTPSGESSTPQAA